MRCLCVRDFSGWLGEGKGVDSGEGGGIKILNIGPRRWLAAGCWLGAGAKCEKVTMSVDNLK